MITIDEQQESVKKALEHSFSYREVDTFKTWFLNDLDPFYAMVRHIEDNYRNSEGVASPLEQMAFLYNLTKRVMGESISHILEGSIENIVSELRVREEE